MIVVRFVHPPGSISILKLASLLQFLIIGHVLITLYDHVSLVKFTLHKGFCIADAHFRELQKFIFNVEDRHYPSKVVFIIAAALTQVLQLEILQECFYYDIQEFYLTFLFAHGF